MPCRLKSDLKDLPMPGLQDKSQVVILSDIHIGSNLPTCWYQKSVHEKPLLGIFDWICQNKATIKEVVLAGDIVDTWTYPFSVQPPTFADIIASNPAVLGPNGGLARVLDALGGAVTYLPGNHDIQITDKDVAQIVSSDGHSLRFSPASLRIGDIEVLHGHQFTLFNAPDLSTPLAPLPVGHFVTRMISTYMQRTLASGKTVADLPDQGNPNGVNWSHIILDVLKKGDLSLSSALLTGLAGQLGVSENEQILLADGTSTTIAKVKPLYQNLFSRWIEMNGGGQDGLLVASKAALADYNSSFMGWFAQRHAFNHNTNTIIFGHTHGPISALACSLVNYVNAGFECPSKPDFGTKPISFVVANTTTGLANIMMTKADDPAIVSPCSAKATSVVEDPFMDYSCYVIIDNSTNNSALTLRRKTVGHGHFIALPQRIEAKSKAKIWLQDYPGLLPPHGSDAVVVYADNAGHEHMLSFDCPTGLYPNSCSGGSRFRAKSGNGAWLASGRVPEKGYPLFVEYTFLSGDFDGSFTGRAGVNSSAISNTGLKPGQQAVINGKTDLSSIVIANDNAKIYSIKLEKISGVYQYRVVVDGQGPAGLFSGQMYLHFIDQTGDRYNLSLLSSSRKIHTVMYNSSAPAIMKIEWNN